MDVFGRKARRDAQLTEEAREHLADGITNQEPVSYTDELDAAVKASELITDLSEARYKFEDYKVGEVAKQSNISPSLLKNKVKNQAILQADISHVKALADTPVSEIADRFPKYKNVLAYQAGDGDQTFKDYLDSGDFTFSDYIDSVKSDLADRTNFLGSGDVESRYHDVIENNWELFPMTASYRDNHFEEEVGDLRTPDVQLNLDGLNEDKGLEQ